MTTRRSRLDLPYDGAFDENLLASMQAPAGRDLDEAALEASWLGAPMAYAPELVAFDPGLGGLGACCSRCASGHGCESGLRGLDYGTNESSGMDAPDYVTNPDRRTQMLQQAAQALAPTGRGGGGGAADHGGGGGGGTPGAPSASAPAAGGGMPLFQGSNVLPGGEGGFDLGTAAIGLVGAGAAAGTILHAEQLPGHSVSRGKLTSMKTESLVGGAVGGAVSGAAIGSMIPVIGTLIGGVVGALGGAAGSIFSQQGVAKKNRKMHQQEVAAEAQARTNQIAQEQAQAKALVAQTVALANARNALDKARNEAVRLAISVRQGGGDFELAQTLVDEAEAIKAHGANETDLAAIQALGQEDAQGVLQDLRALEQASRPAPGARRALAGLGSANAYVFEARKRNRAALGLTPQGGGSSEFLGTIATLGLGALLALEAPVILKRLKGLVR